MLWLAHAYAHTPSLDTSLPVGSDSGGSVRFGTGLINGLLGLVVLLEASLH